MRVKNRQYLTKETAKDYTAPDFWRDAPTEFEVQAKAYQELLRGGYITRGEIRVINPAGRSARFDLVIFDDKFKPLLTIEVKDNADARPHPKKEHYEIIAGCPNIQISGMTEARNAMKIVGSYLK